MIQMQKIVRTVLFRMFPEMEQKLHLVQFGIIKGVPPVPEGGEIYKWEEPYVGVDIQLLDEFDAPFGPIYTGVPYPTPAGDNNRGFYGFPQIGTRVSIQYAYGDPERPLITNVYMFDKHLPALKEHELLIQQSPATSLRANEDETWIHKARNHYLGAFTDFTLNLRNNGLATCTNWTIKATQTIWHECRRYVLRANAIDISSTSGGWRLKDKEILIRETDETYLFANREETWIHEAKKDYIGTFTNQSVTARKSSTLSAGESISMIAGEATIKMNKQGKVWLGNKEIDLTTETYKLAEEVEKIAQKLKFETIKDRAAKIKQHIKTIKT